jgi:hypothetical protein
MVRAGCRRPSGNSPDNTGSARQPVAVIPPHWLPVRRPEDDELVGYLVPDGAEDIVVPTTLLGTPLGAPGPVEHARRLLVVAGLRAVAGRWWCRLPAALPRGLLTASSPSEDWPWRPAIVVEASPVECRIRPEWPDPEELAGQAPSRAS